MEQFRYGKVQGVTRVDILAQSMSTGGAYHRTRSIETVENMRYFITQFPNWHTGPYVLTERATFHIALSGYALPKKAISHAFTTHNVHTIFHIKLLENAH